MNQSILRSYRTRFAKIAGSVAERPLLFLGVDLPFLVVGAVTLKNAAGFSLQMLLIHFTTLIVAWLFTSKLDTASRIAINSMVSTLAMLASRELVVYLIPDIENQSGMYLYLMAFNGITFFQANFVEFPKKSAKVMSIGLLNVTAFGILMFGIAGFREYVGSGTLWGMPMLHLLPLPGVAAPFFGFIILGFLLAFMRFLGKQLARFYLLEQTRKAQ